QPLAAVEADLDRERKPGLDARMHEAEQRMDLVVVQVQALAAARLEIDELALALPHDLVAQAGLDGADPADQALADPVGPSDLARHRLLAHPARRQVADR